MANDNSFAEIFDDLTHNYGKLEGILSDLYQYLQSKPDDEMARNLFDRLCILGQDMIFSQREFAKSYGDPSLNDGIIKNLDLKSQSLSQVEANAEVKLK